MKLRNNNGFAGVDISISIIIILIFIPTIFGIAYNIQKTNFSAQNQATAVGIASDILEIAKAEKYEDVKLSQDSKFIEDINKKYKQIDSINDVEEEEGYEYKYYLLTKENQGAYQIQIGLKNYYPKDVEQQNQEDLIKIIKIKVFYSLTSNEKTVDISMALENN